MGVILQGWITGWYICQTVDEWDIIFLPITGTSSTHFTHLIPWGMEVKDKGIALMFYTTLGKLSTVTNQSCYKTKLFVYY